jgi:hypothetical protein
VTRRLRYWQRIIRNKREPVFAKRSRSTNKLKRDDRFDPRLSRFGPPDLWPFREAGQRLLALARLRTLWQGSGRLCAGLFGRFSFQI